MCGDNVAVLKEYNLKRHYETKHEPDYSKYEDKLRDDKIEELKLMLNKQQTLFYKVNKESETAVRASYVIAEEIAKKRKPFSDGEFIKDCMMRAAEIVCPDKKQCFLNISLSRNTIAKRITDLSDNIHLQLTEKAKSFITYSFAVDESTDIADISQVAVFIRGVDEDLNITEELAALLPLTETTKGTDVMTELDKLMATFELDYQRMKGLTTDGAPAMCSKNVGLQGLIQKTRSEKGIEGFFLHSHCIIHQEACSAT